MHTKTACFWSFLSLASSSAWAGETTRVSVDSSGNQANYGGRTAAISSDGRFVAFRSFASNLVPGDTNAWPDIFVHDRLTGQTERVSVDSSGNQTDGDSDSPSISSDGRYVAFYSGATNLVPGDTNGLFDIFVHDRVTAQTTRVSVDSSGNQGNRDSYLPSISSDGLCVAFESRATNFVPGDTNGVGDVFVHDRVSGQTTRVSVDSGGVEGNASSLESSLSADGAFVAFGSSATNLVPGDTNGQDDIFVHDRSTGQTTCVSVGSNGNQSEGFNATSSISSDGRTVAFRSGAANLVSGDTNGQTDIFLHDRTTGETVRISVDSSGNQADSFSGRPSVSSDGRCVAFYSGATNLVPGDTNGWSDVFVRDRIAGQTTRASVSTSGGEGNHASGFALLGLSLSGNARSVAFESIATNLVPGDTNLWTDVFAHERTVGTPYCFGDGAGTPCPCNNAGGSAEGCANSTGAGVEAVATGSSSVATDDLGFAAVHLPPMQPALLFVGDDAVNGGAGVTFGDGLRCAGANVVRLGVKSANAAGGTHWGPGLRATGGWNAGETKRFQVWYRDPGGSPCGSNFNLSNGIEVHFDP